MEAILHFLEFIRMFENMGIIFFELDLDLDLFFIKFWMAKTIQSAIVGKLIPAIIKAYGKKVIGINMNKVMHFCFRLSIG